MDEQDKMQLRQIGPKIISGINHAREGRVVLDRLDNQLGETVVGVPFVPAYMIDRITQFLDDEMGKHSVVSDGRHPDRN